MEIPWAARKSNKCVLDQVKPELSLEANIMKLRLSYSGHIMRRQDSLEKIIMLRRVEGSRKRERPNIRWIDFLMEPTCLNLQELSREVAHRTFWRSFIHMIT